MCHKRSYTRLQLMSGEIVQSVNPNTPNTRRTRSWTFRAVPRLAEAYRGLVRGRSRRTHCGGSRLQRAPERQLARQVCGSCLGEERPPPRPSQPALAAESGSTSAAGAGRPGGAERAPETGSQNPPSPPQSRGTQLATRSALRKVLCLRGRRCVLSLWQPDAHNHRAFHWLHSRVKHSIWQPS